MSAGIDYGMGTTNMDPVTRVRYGVIQANHVGEVWYDRSESVYPEDLTDEDMEYAEPIGFSYEDSEYTLSQGDDGDIFVLKSPYYTLCRFCSPCAPGAGYLEAQDDMGIAAYCLGPEWFEDDKAPYAVYRLSDNVCVYRAQEEEE